MLNYIVSLHLIVYSLNQVRSKMLLFFAKYLGNYKILFCLLICLETDLIDKTTKVDLRCNLGLLYGGGWWCM